MGAAKNARKARRKARRLQDRRPYIIDIEAYNYLLGPGTSFSYSDRGLSVVTVWDPRQHKNVETGHRLDLTIAEAAELRALSRGTVTPYEDTPKPLFNKGYQTLLDLTRESLSKHDPFAASMFDSPWMNDMSRRMAPPREWRIPHIKPDGSVGIDPKRGTVSTTKTFADIDYSMLEDRILDFMGKQIDKKAFYASLYGATEERVRDLYLDSISYGDLARTHREAKRVRFDDLYMQYPVYTINGPRPYAFVDDPMDTKPLPPPADGMADPLDRVYRGQKIGDIVRSHPLNQKVTKDDQDLPEVGSVPAHRS